MKHKNRFLIGGISLLTAVLFLVGCMDNSLNYIVPEMLLVHNRTDSTIYIEYGFLLTLNFNDHRVTDSIPATYLNGYQFDTSLIKGLWMSEKDFNTYVSKIRIYKLKNGDTTFVAPHYYNTKSAWAYKFDNQGYENSPKINLNELTILPTMFNQ